LADLQNLGNLSLDLSAPYAPKALALEANASLANDAIDVSGLRVGLGQSDLEASGRLKDPLGAGALRFKSQLALGELGNLVKVSSARPQGKVLLNGEARLDANGHYDVAGNVAAQNVSFESDTQRIRDLNLVSALRLDPHRLDLNGLRLSALGSELSGDASLEDYARYNFRGRLQRLDLRTVAGVLGERNLPYDGIVSGPIEAAGDLKASGAKSLVAQAGLSIAPGRRGIPVSGRLNLQYDGTADNLSVGDSYIALPHTRLTLRGSVGKRLDLDLTTRDLNDLLAAAALRGPPPVALNGGQVAVTASVTGSLSAPRISGHVEANRFSVEGRGFDTLAADLAASPSGASVSRGNLSRGAMQTTFSASVGLRNWKTPPAERVSADANVRNGDLADILALAGQPNAGYSGALSVTAHASGTLGNPLGAATLAVTNGTIDNEPFDQLQAKLNLTDRLVSTPDAYITAGTARIDLSAELQHPRESFTTGSLHATVKSTPVDLARFQNALKQWPGTSGQAQIQAELRGVLCETSHGGATKSEFELGMVNADVSLRHLRFEGQSYGDLTATARTNAQTVHYDLVSDFAGSSIHANGDTKLAPSYPTEAEVNISKLPIERVLAVAKNTDIPARGLLSASGHIAGTLDNPQGDLNLGLVNATLYDEPIDSAKLRLIYLPRSIEAQQAEIVAGQARITLAARFDHPVGNLRSGAAQFHLDSSGIDLGKIRNLQKARPGLGGRLKIAGDGKARLDESRTPGSLQELNLNVAATGVSVNQKAFGDLTLTAKTTAGQLNVALDSNLANASIHGSGWAVECERPREEDRGMARLSRDYTPFGKYDSRTGNAHEARRVRKSGTAGGKSRSRRGAHHEYAYNGAASRIAGWWKRLDRVAGARPDRQRAREPRRAPELQPRRNIVRKHHTGGRCARYVG
jgi:translocation and assembly module TamB